MKQRVRKKAQRKRRNLWIGIATVLVIAAVAVWGAYFRDNVTIDDHISTSCTLMLAAKDLRGGWDSVRKLPQWSYAVKNYGNDMPWLSTFDTVSQVKEWFLMNFVGKEVRLVLCDSPNFSASTPLVYLRLSKLAKFSDLLARLIRRVPVESHEGVKIRQVETGGTFYYTVLGRVLIGGRSRGDVVRAAKLSSDARFVTPLTFVQMQRGGIAPRITLYCNMENGSGTGGTNPLSAVYAVVGIEQDAIRARFEAPFSQQFRDNAAHLTEKMEARTLRTATRMPADAIVALTVCGSAPLAKILESAAQAFEVPQLRPDNWRGHVTGRGATLAAVSGALFGELVRELNNEATVALTNIDVYEIIPTPEFLLFGEASQKADTKFLDKMEQTAKGVGTGGHRLQRKTLRGVGMAYLDLPEGRSLQLCMAEIGGILAMTTSEYALDSFLDAVLGNKPSIKMTEPDLIKPEQGANLVFFLSVQRVIESSRDIFELLLEYDLIVDMDREKYDRQVSPWLGLLGLLRSVVLNAFLGSDSIKGDISVPFAKI